VRLLDKECDSINLIAPAMASELHRLGFSGNNFSHIPNGVSIHKTPSAIFLRPHRFLAVGRIAPEKGYNILIEAMSLLSDQLQPGLVRIAGGGSERTSLQALAQSLGVAHAIEWLGELEHHQVLRELEQSQVFLLPSRYEGMSNAGLEAMERGLAMLMTRCGGLDAYIQPEMGWVVEPGDANALAAAMNQAMQTTSDMVSRMGERNRACVLQNFSLTSIAARYLDLFESLRQAQAGNTSK
jgi:glycosyltransferase involved in cell wall biosynthesis